MRQRETESSNSVQRPSALFYTRQGRGANGSNLLLTGASSQPYLVFDLKWLIQTSDKQSSAGPTSYGDKEAGYLQEVEKANYTLQCEYLIGNEAWGMQVTQIRVFHKWQPDLTP